MRDTFLFDLDGTLLPMDFDHFMKLYFTNLGKFFYQKIDPKELADYVMQATNYMIQTKNHQTNEEKFMEYFGSKIDGDIEAFKSGFIAFYDSLFEEVKPSTQENESMKKSVQLLKEKGYNVVVATNPLFPIQANYHRLRWAGFTKEEFLHISSFEENKYCKPHLEYYQEVLEAINKKPENCYMVGNDIHDDLPAQLLGIPVYIITDCMLNHKQLENTADYQGSYKEFYQFVQSLPNLQTTK
jgi:FMN phosphatase YigB (HAD superfamily)